VQLFKKTYETYGRVDILVNNAGVPTHVPIEDITLKYWQEVLDVNLTAAFLCSREAIKIMKSQTPQGGRVINIGSVSGKTPRPDSLPYTATKFALQGMTHQLTMDGRKYGVVASILHPGATLSVSPRGRRAAEQRDEIASLHSITPSARASSVGGTATGHPFDTCR